MNALLLNAERRAHRRGTVEQRARAAVRDHAYRRLGEYQTEQILATSRPIREHLPVLGLPASVMAGEFHPVISGAAGFTSYNDIINALTTNARGQRLNFQKTSVTTVAATPYSMWGNGGMPAAGVFGTALTGVVRTSADVGAIPYANPTLGRFMYLLRYGMGSTAAIGTLLLYDRLVDYPFNGTVTGAQNFNGGTGIAPPSRDVNAAALGAGVLMFMENDVTGAATAATGPTETITYTNDAGTAARSTGAITLRGAIATSGVIFNNASPGIWFPLQSGDFGVRSIQSHNISATITTTKATIVLARPLAFLPMLNASSYVERDLVLQTPSLPRIMDSTCFAFLLIANTTTCQFTGELLIAEN